ncbi:MAG TPA: isoamylase early set domain-containing protein [Gemmatimonadales bacterium]|nr:isoamylase early set domain-containing protein [Gemmatimonadales bacterium]
MTDKDDALDPIIDILREPAALRADLTDRVMAEIEGEAVRPVRWWRHRWTVRLSPLHGLGLAAGLAALVFAVRVSGRPAAPAGPPPGRAVTQFVLIAPGAQSVTVVGDFNDWSLSATPLERAGEVWSVSVPLGPGRYRYAFVVNGDIWRPDPEAPRTDDEFGRANSVVTVGGRKS